MESKSTVRGAELHRRKLFLKMDSDVSFNRKLRFKPLHYTALV